MRLNLAMMPLNGLGSSYQSVLLIQGAGADEIKVHEALSGWESGKFQVTWVRTLAAALDWLGNEALHHASSQDRRIAIVVDLFLADVQGIETFARLHRAAPRVPILVLCRREDEAVARLAIERGAQDYLLKEQLDDYLLGKALASMIQRAAVAEHRRQRDEAARITLDSIGDAVISTDVFGRITYLNGVAESVTGWTRAAASGQATEAVLPLIDGESRQAVQSPMAQAVRENRTVALSRNCILKRRDGREIFIEDSSAPIRDSKGRVTGAVMVFHDVSEVRAQSRHMSFLAQHDSLTDLPNRMLLQDRLTQALTLAQRHPDRTVAVLFVDLDGFKAVNDSLGHAVGDQLLKSVARRLLGCVRSADTVSRLGGDEFVILLPDLKQARDATAVTEKILCTLRAPHRISQQLVRVTASIGIATLPQGQTDAALLLKNADLAMYHAKAGGRNSYQFFEPALHERALGSHAGNVAQLQSA